jgi:hypothetical protein
MRWVTDMSSSSADCAFVDVYEALEQARDWIGGYGHERAEKVAIIDAALAKARGEQVSA